MNQGATSPATEAEQKIRNDFPVPVQLERRDLVERVAPRKPRTVRVAMTDEKTSGPNISIATRTEDDLGHEKRAGDRRIIGRSNASGRAATDQQTQPRRRPIPQTPGKRCD